MSDSLDEPTSDDDDNLDDTLGGLLISLGKRINWVMAILLFIMYIVLHSSWWLENIMSKKTSWVMGDQLSSKGEIITGLFLAMGVIVLSMLTTS